jgi:hypothetical protein
MTRPGLVAANNLSDIVNNEKAWDSLGSSIFADFGIIGGLDADAEAYIRAVSMADGEILESFVQFAINNFVTGCKSDGIWNAIQASCILSGARTINGALVPLKGIAPTNVGPLLASDYNRKTGLQGNGSTKYLNSNRAGNADAQNNKHLACYRTAYTGGHIAMGNQRTTSTEGVGGSAMSWGGGGSDFFVTLSNRQSAPGTVSSNAFGFWGVSRSSSASVIVKYPNNLQTIFINSDGNLSQNLSIFRATGATGGAVRLPFYSMGASVDLVRLEARVNTLVADIAAALP